MRKAEEIYREAELKADAALTVLTPERIIEAIEQAQREAIEEAAELVPLMTVSGLRGADLAALIRARTGLQAAIRSLHREEQ